jgi:hypothetical protein
MSSSTTHVIEVIAHDPKTDQVVLMMSQTEPWSGTAAQLKTLEEKFNVYVSYALDGGLVDEFPTLKGKKTRIELTCLAFPDEKTLEFLEKVRADLAKQRLEFLLNVREVVTVPDSSCAEGTCGCHDGAGERN